MRILKFYAEKDRAHWLSEIGKCDWSAGRLLYELLRDDRLKGVVGQTADVLMLTDGKRLAAFCTLAPLDDIQPTELTPWIGFLYTFPAYRGHRYAGRLLAYAENAAKESGGTFVYISTTHTGLYEKYGYEFLKTAKDTDGGDSRIYRKPLM